MGVISEAGCPAVADPGADVVAIAQRKNLRVVPLVGLLQSYYRLWGSRVFERTEFCLSRIFAY